MDLAVPYQQNIYNKNLSLYTFLSGTRDPQSPLAILRGHQDVLMKVWETACEEWWQLHVFHSPKDIPNFSVRWRELGDGVNYPKHRKESGGCPIVVIDDSVVFPSPKSEPLIINMMPIRLDVVDYSLPSTCMGYKPLIDACVPYLTEQRRSGNTIIG
jgi:hypothetical protein